jgi:7-carboxy-7-deazaguanine synthase
LGVSQQLAINEIFFSIQGESTHAGRPCAFVRLMGCPLRCQYCDTEYAFFEGQKKSFDEIFDQLKKFGCSLVEVTGGEPLAQPNCIPFMKRLVAEGYEVLLETSGAFSIADVPPEVSVILDVKTPGSGELSRMHWDNLKVLKPHKDEVKFVICSRADFDFAEKVVSETGLLDRNTVLMSPSFKQVPYIDLASWVMESKKPYRMQIQMHKHIWEPTARGV